MKKLNIAWDVDCHDTAPKSWFLCSNTLLCDETLCSGILILFISSLLVLKWRVVSREMLSLVISFNLILTLSSECVEKYEPEMVVMKWTRKTAEVAQVANASGWKVGIDLNLYWQWFNWINLLLIFATIVLLLWRIHLMRICLSEKKSMMK